MNHGIIDPRLERLVDLLDSDDPRLASFRAEGTAEAAGRLIGSILRDEAVDMRILAIAISLASAFSSPSVTADLVDVIRRQPAVAMTAGTSLARCKDRSTLRALETILLDRSVSPESRAGAARALGWLFDSAVKHALLEALRGRDEDPVVLQATLHALGMSQLHEESSDAAETIAELLSAASPDVRLVAITVLGNIGARRTLRRVAALLGDDATTATGRQVSEEAARVVMLLAGQHDTLTRFLAACIAGDHGDWTRVRHALRESTDGDIKRLRRRLETVQYMSDDAARSLSHYYLAKRIR